MDSCWKGQVLTEIHIDELKESVERGRLRIQEGEGKDGIRSLWR